MAEKYTYYDSTLGLLDLMNKYMPDVRNAYYGPVKEAVYSDGVLGEKNKRLMSLAVALQAGCRECIISQTMHALNLGASLEELFETCGVAVSMGGTLAISKTLIVFEYLLDNDLIHS